MVRKVDKKSVKRTVAKGKFVVRDASTGRFLQVLTKIKSADSDVSSKKPVANILKHQQLSEQNTEASALEAPIIDQKSPRSIREMVIDNDRKFNATMKSLGE